MDSILDPKTGVIGNQVWLDADADGILDLDEEVGVAGVSVILTGAGADGEFGTEDDMTVTGQTNLNGKYSFTGLAAGSYKVTFGLPTGFKFTTPGVGIEGLDSDVIDPLTGMTDVVVLEPEQRIFSVDAGLVPMTGAIGDRVWYDDNGDGVQDAGEDGINGVTVKLINKDTGDVIATDVTEGDGGYLFDGLASGNYTVMVDTSTLPDGNLVQTGDPDADLDDMSMEVLDPGETNLGQDFGYQRLGAIGDRVWFDNNGDGIQDVGEGGINGVTVKLINKDTGEELATDVTEGDGEYLFEDLAQGNYTVMVDTSTLPDGVVQTGDPDADLDDMSMEDLAAGETDLEQDFGYQLQNPGIDIEKFVNGIDVTDLTSLPEIAAGADVTFTYDVRNTGNVAFTVDQVKVVDDNGTPGDPSDDFAPILDLSSDNGSDLILSVGETWRYVSDTVPALDLNTTKPAVDLTFVLTGNTPLDGPDGNVRTFSEGGVSVDVSGFRKTSGGAWQKAYLGAYSGGLGVTNPGEGTSGHRIDNGGSKDYVLFEFDQDVVVDRAFLASVNNDSDITVWLGDRNGADISILSDGLLNSYEKEHNTTNSSFSRWANINQNGIVGNTLIVAAKVNNSNDAFKLKKLDISVPGEVTSGEYINTVTVTADDVGDSDKSGYVNPNVPADPSIDIEKLTNGVDADTPASAVQIQAGSQVAWTYKVTNDGNIAFNQADITVTDDQEGVVTDIIDQGDGDNILSPGEMWVYQKLGTAQKLTRAGSTHRFYLTGNSLLDGGNGNIRTFSSGGVSVKTSAFSRSSYGTWQTAFLGAFSSGLGVTDRSEGNGGNGLHRVDNVYNDNYVLFEFSEQVVVDDTLLASVVGDSDITYWVGTADDPFNNHNTLNDGFLNDLDLKQNNLGGSSARWADLNEDELAGNILVIAARTNETHPGDRFKIKALDIQAVESGIYQNTGTVDVFGIQDSDLSHYVNVGSPNLLATLAPES